MPTVEPCSDTQSKNALIRVLIVDDQSEDRHALRVAVNNFGFTIVGQVDNSCHNIHQILEIQPSVMLLDLDMPFIDGLRTLRSVRKRYAWLPVLVISRRPAQTYARRCMRLGAMGFLVKGEGPLLLSCAIAQVMQGQMLFPNTSSIEVPSFSDQLSDAELVTLRCVVSSGDAMLAAQVLNVSVERARRVIRNLQTRLGIESREALVSFGKQLPI